MPGPLTLAVAQARLQVWLDADLAVAGGQSHVIGNRAYSATDAATIRDNIKYWRGVCKELEQEALDGGDAPTITNGLPC